LPFQGEDRGDAFPIPRALPGADESEASGLNCLTQFVWNPDDL
jgi:hypothetical protein